MSRRVINIFTKLEVLDTGLVLDESKARAAASNKKFDYYVMDFDVYSVRKRDKEVSLIGNIKYQGSKKTQKIGMVASNNHIVLVSDDFMWKVDLSLDPPQLYILAEEDFDEI